MKKRADKIEVDDLVIGHDGAFFRVSKIEPVGRMISFSLDNIAGYMIAPSSKLQVAKNSSLKVVESELAKDLLASLGESK